MRQSEKKGRKTSKQRSGWRAGEGLEEILHNFLMYSTVCWVGGGGGAGGNWFMDVVKLALVTNKKL